MDKQLQSLLGLLNDPKREYRLVEGEVTAIDWEYATILDQILFGDRGLCETLSGTWEMIHDPRFTKIEAIFIQEKKAKLGGDARTGVQRQTKDGGFTGGMDAIEQYTEVLEEGRILLKALRSMAIMDALETFLEGPAPRIILYDANDIHRGIKIVAPYTPAVRQKLWETFAAKIGLDPQALVSDTDEFLYANVQEYLTLEEFTALGLLSPAEKTQVSALADALQEPGRKYNPKAFKDWSNNSLWTFIKREYANYFTRSNKPNRMAENMFNLIKMDVCGLLTDFAEVANIQEVVLLENPDELYEPEKHGEDAYRVSAEVEMLERALSFRAQLRVTAARVLNHLGISEAAGKHFPELTDFERDQLLRIVYSSKWPDEQPQMVSNILAFFGSINVSGKKVSERREEQLAVASENARKRNWALLTGEIKPISRETEGVDSIEKTPEERTLANVTNNPVALDVYMQLTALREQLTSLLPKTIVVEPGIPVEELVQLRAQVDECTTGPDFAIVVGDACTQLAADAEKRREDRIDRLTKAIAILEPLFVNETFVWTDEAVADHLAQVSALLPKEAVEVPQFEGVYHGKQWSPGDSKSRA